MEKYPWVIEQLINRPSAPLSVEDLRPSVADETAHTLRLLCLTGRGPSYSFTVHDLSTPKARMHWREAELTPSGHQSRSGSLPIPESTRQRLLELTHDVGFESLAATDRPYSIGHPYIFVIEVVEKGQHRLVWRDTPTSSSEERGLIEFNQIARALILSAQIQMPEPAMQVPEASGKAAP